MSLRVDLDGTVVVSAPPRVSQRGIDRFVARWTGWIEKTRERVRRHADRHPPIRWTDGAAVTILGMPWRLEVPSPNGARRRSVREEDGRLVVALPAAQGADPRTVRGAVKDWSIRRLKTAVSPLIASWAGRLGVRPGALRVGDQKTQWGACSHTGTVSLNWRLALLAAPLMEYVVVHELCHLRHANHGPRFWELMASVMPDALERRAALRRESYRLMPS